MLVIFDVVILIYGGYTIYSALNMKRTRRLNSFLTGSDSTSSIRDVQGYIDYIFGRILVMGGMAVIFGIVGLINDYVTPIPNVLRAMVLLFLTVCVWFYVSINRAKSRFW